MNKMVPGLRRTGCCAILGIWKSRDSDSEDESSEDELTGGATGSTDSDSGF